MSRFGRKKPSEEASSSSKKRPSRLKFWRRPKLGGPGEAAPAKDDYKPDNGVIIPEPSSSSRATDEPKLPSAPRPAPPELSPTSNNKDGGATATSSESLWDLAYEALRKEKPEVVQAYEELLSKMSFYLANASCTTDLNDVLSKASNDLANKTPTSDTKTAECEAHNVMNPQKTMSDVINLGLKHMERKQIAFNIGRQKFVLQDQMQHVVAGIQLGKDWIDDAVQASPLAGAAWAGICLLLPLLTNPSEVQRANEGGLAYVNQKIRYYTAMESLSLRGEDDDVERVYRSRLVELYQAIIDFQAQSVLRFFRRRFANFLRDAVKWDLWEDMLEKIKELGCNVENESLQINAASSRAALGKLVQWAKESEEDKCLQSLRRGDYAWYKDRVQDRVPDTCLWFLNHDSYQSWLTADSGPLLVSADPGCGKSVLARYLIDSRLGFRLPKNAAICYFFFKDPDQNTIELALCALVHQLLCLRPKLMRHALPRYKQDGAELANNVTALWDILESATADPEAGTVVIVLDALDECLQNERNMETLSRYIHGHFRKRPGNLKILMTSRPYEGTIQHIQDLEKSFPNIRIKGEDDSETIREEINSVIGYRVSRMEKFNDDLKAHLKKRLMSSTHRTYLWLYLVFEHLKHTVIKKTVSGLDKAFEDLPKTLDEAYEKILSRSKKPAETRKAIRILLGAYRPLTLREMQVAVGLATDTKRLEDLDLEPDDCFGQRLRDWCGLFIAVHDNKVYFLHQTAREFLLPLAMSLPGPTTLTKWAHTFSIRQAHEALAESCTVYLDLRTDVNMEADFLDYSAKNWGAHFREASIVDGAAIIPFALRVSDPNSKCHSAWFDIYWQSKMRVSYGNFTSLIIASHFGHEAVVKLLLGTGKVDIDSKDKNGHTPLWWAATNGHEAVVKLLLGTGKVDIDSKNNKFRLTPLWMAAKRGHEAVVKLLLDTGKVDINSKDKNGHTPLWMAATNGHEAVVKLLLGTGKVDVDSKDEYGRTPLSWAAANGHEAVVKLLLDTGKVDIDSKDEKYGQTPLSWAAATGHEGIVKLLLDTGKVDIDSKDEDGQTPLSWAAAHGHEAVVKLLSKDGDGLVAKLLKK